MPVRTPKPAAPPARPASAKAATDLFAGELEYANVTEFRESLLPLLGDLERDPAKRYLVTRHGKPLGVFLSFRAFEALRRVVDSALASQAQQDTAGVLASARHRMDHDHGVAPAATEGAGDLARQVATLQIDHERLKSIVKSLTRRGGRRVAPKRTKVTESR